MAKKTTHPNGAKATKPASDQKTGALIQMIGLNMLMIGLVALLAFLAWQRYVKPKANDYEFTQTEGQMINPAEAAAPAEEVDVLPTPLPDNDVLAALGPLAPPPASADGILRKTNLKTIIPTRPRTNVITYTVQTGDTLFSIAANFGIKPETLLWGNYEVLNDNPHFLKPKQVLNILPVDGTYYQWKEGDTLSGVANFFQADPQDIISYSGNFIDLTQTTNGNAGVDVGTWIIVPGGKRAIKDWGPPAISRSNPAVARYYGDGACGAVYEGAVGTGTFVWPTTDHGISGYTYDSGVHPGVDIAGAEGNPIYATDSGVVVFAGWSDYGYGYMIVIDHGNGWQSAYAHLSAVGVSCGQSVYQGGHIGALGNTGNSSGPHLHFELAINGAKVNPLDYIR